MVFLDVGVGNAVPGGRGDDLKCRPHQYGPGQAFVDKGGGHVHIGRNEGTVTVKLLVTFIVPVGAAPRIDVPAPGNCPF
jgi:hypothetical protein